MKHRMSHNPMDKSNEEQDNARSLVTSQMKNRGTNLIYICATSSIWGSHPPPPLLTCLFVASSDGDWNRTVWLSASVTPDSRGLPCYKISPYTTHADHERTPQRDYRERWSMPTVETELNWDLKKTNETGPSFVGLLGLSCQYKRFLSCLGCSSRPSTKYIFPHRTLVHFLCTHRPASGQAAVLGRLSFNMRLWASEQACHRKCPP
jgi:hypothetical protein